jgi:hypothetical protein
MTRTANHSGASEGLPPSFYKLFVKSAANFKWIVDADKDGKVIDTQKKHKGETGQEIDNKGFFVLTGEFFHRVVPHHSLTGVQRM